jgi:SSS family solute:Na+ symporter
MNTLLFLIVFGALGTLYFILGIRASRTVKTDLDYFVANRQLGTWQISCNLIATQLGGGMLLGTAAVAYTNGYYGILYTLGMALGFLLLSSGIAARLQQFQVTTTAQLFETQYGSPFLKKVASFFSIMTLFGILIAQVIGFKSLMASIGFGAGIITLPFWLSVIAYTMIGGLRAITINDMVQLGIITVTFVGIFIYTLWTMPSNFFSLASFYSQQQLFTPESISFTAIFGVIFMPALFSLIEQDLAQRFFASKSKTVAMISALNAAIFLLLFAIIPVYLGMQAKLMNIIVPQGANPLLILLQTMLPDIIFAFALCAIIAAIISTADALMNGISANITQDFDIAQYGLGKKLTVSKITTLVVGLAALAASYFVPQDAIAILIGSYELSVSCLLVPLLFCYFRKKVNKNAAFVSIGAGFIGFFVFRIYPIAIPKELLALLLSFIGYIIGDTLRYTGKS